jgi:hypothetical protein
MDSNMAGVLCEYDLFLFLSQAEHEVLSYYLRALL